MCLPTAPSIVLRASVIILHSPLTALAAFLPAASPTWPSPALPSASVAVLSSGLVPYDPSQIPNATAEDQAFRTQPHVKFHVPNSEIDLTFRHFGRAIPRYEFMRENVDAIARTYRTIKDGHGDEPIVHGLFTHRMHFADGMSITYRACDFDMHERPMMFRDLWNALRGLGFFMTDGEGRFAETNYEIDHERRGYIGFASLKYERLESEIA
ncbi:MAG: hypothetical protein Q9167_004312 [Letrouitia subvulpina]